MNIETVEIDNFLRIGRMRLELTGGSVHMICGHNEAGKTSLQEAIRFCLLGETSRVKLKGDYKLMVKDGAASGLVRMTVDGRRIERDIQTGRGSAEDHTWPDALEYLLDATRYGWQDDKARRKFMFGLLRITISQEEVRKRLRQDHAIPDHMADTIMPMLKAGFDAAHRYCKEQTSEARGGWKATTGENYGAQKAKDWTPDLSKEVDVLDYTRSLAEYAKLQNKVEALAEEVGRTKGAKSGDFMALGQIFNCPNCDARICIDRLHNHKQIRVVTKEEEARTLAEAQLMADEIEPPSVAALESARAERDKAAVALDAMKEIQARTEGATELYNQAQAYHQQVQMWDTAATALAPTGIPSEMIAEKLKPLNDRLRETAMQTGWPQVSVTPDMKIMVDNRIFQLQSESAQWRAQAAIAEAISFISGVGILVLDRVDVLDIKNRVALIKWALKMGEHHNNVLLIGTFKEPPKVPAAITVHWLEDGKLINQEAEAA